MQNLSCKGLTVLGTRLQGRQKGWATASLQQVPPMMTQMMRALQRGLLQMGPTLQKLLASVSPGCSRQSMSMSMNPGCSEAVLCIPKCLPEKA